TKTTMYGPPEGCCVFERWEPSQIQPSGITVHIDSAASIITAITKPAAAPVAAPATGPCRLTRSSIKRRVRDRVIGTHRCDRPGGIRAARSGRKRDDRLRDRGLHQRARRSTHPGPKRRVGLARRGAGTGGVREGGGC